MLKNRTEAEILKNGGHPKLRALKAAFPYTLPIFAGFWLIGLAASAVCLALFGADSFLIPSMLCILFCLSAFRGPIEKAGVWAK